MVYYSSVYLDLDGNEKLLTAYYKALLDSSQFGFSETYDYLRCSVHLRCVKTKEGRKEMF